MKSTELRHALVDLGSVSGGNNANDFVVDTVIKSLISVLDQTSDREYGNLIEGQERQKPINQEADIALALNGVAAQCRHFLVDRFPRSCTFYGALRTSDCTLSSCPAATLPETLAQISFSYC